KMREYQLAKKLEKIREISDYHQLDDARIAPIIEDYFDQVFLGGNYDIHFSSDPRFSMKSFSPGLQAFIFSELMDEDKRLAIHLDPGKNDRNFYFYNKVRMKFGQFKLKFLRDYHFTRPLKQEIKSVADLSAYCYPIKQGTKKIINIAPEDDFADIKSEIEVT